VQTARKERLERAFVNVDNCWFTLIGDALAKRYEQRESGVDCRALDDEVRGGATALVAIVCDQQLFVANCGDCRAVLVKEGEHNQLTAVQLSQHHDLQNPEERNRLIELHLNPDIVGEPTRCIGDYYRKSGWSEKHDSLCSDPVIPRPTVLSLTMDDSFRYLLLMSGGVVNAMRQTDTAGLDHVTARIAELTVREVLQEHSLSRVAQAVLDAIARDHQHAFVEKLLPSGCNRRDEMTLLVVRLCEGRDIVPCSEASEESLDDKPAVLQLDENGCVASYVDFSSYQDHPLRTQVVVRLTAITEKYRQQEALLEESDIESDDQHRF